ncbi:DUF4865 family protein [Liquorilactobacillus satsumensis]|uniref:DUF4865 domain-containing protein n=1 Tax=Liquorilactobacillus satsumensis DSM 16230 = JCM 12392 TaxID=1423801 RepID=A0A0R1V064_9LACO|nr:DUF4865 family protein [Liquorilactobacillus satsumensis]KRL98951.1 hypothetical protein FD50_GL000770 [Liquorilactobacillus satsumensis DSM 16230 = JCM 12392]MCC7666211.1 DUF4865 domain-containing protein [Liquorilactobacillus satsumensis]MCP9327874.1 DUF4865 family protein [Liquorilactobacillus satsumensis]MCP9358791.1 DUF4865 family protein [Liquorilactobacillus satsumensis]MCP9372725.1 DUF4865 family protein [Liquorilactobacillus satsumensis]
MDAMRYDITLPADYDMNIIRNRVRDNGHLMDGFNGLLFKAFLISERSQGELSNSYSPLYVWKDSEGMNKFIFNGFFDNILQSFGWQNIEIGITTVVKLEENFKKSKYVIEKTDDILPGDTLQNTNLNATLSDTESGKLVIYNPDKWKKVTFSFSEARPKKENNIRCFEVLHISTQ